ncbi:MAG: hypothetical protein KJ621_21140 [Proteobacteria bacterium]|nr:hypothetical protein [Pseudomonadota bacterium]
MTIEKGKRRRMANLLVKEISIVDKPANGRRFLLMKSEGGNDMAKKIEIGKSDEVEILSIKDFEEGLNTLVSTLTESFQGALKNTTKQEAPDITAITEKIDSLKAIMEKGFADNAILFEKLILQTTEAKESKEKEKEKEIDESTKALAESLLTQEEIDALASAK